MNYKYLAAGVLLVTIIFAPLQKLSAHEQEGTLDKVSRTGEFVIGFELDANPLSYRSKSGEPSGYSVDFCRRIGAAVKSHLGRSDIKIKYVPVSLNERISSVESGKVDIECGSATITLSRQEKVDFTLPTFITGGSVMSKADSGIKSIGLLAGKKVGVAKTTTTSEQLAGYLKDNFIDAEVVLTENRTEGMKQLTEGKIDAFASDQIVLIGMMLESGDAKQFTLAHDTFSYEPYGLIVRRNDADFRLVANRTLSQMYRTGQHSKMYKKWMGRSGIRPSKILAAMYQLNIIPE